LGAEHDHLDAVIGRDRESGGGSGVEPPLEDVAFNNECAWNGAFGRALSFGANVDEYRTCFDDLF
jgi:hypothetical protein